MDNMKNLIQQAQDKKYTDFEAATKDILGQKVAQKLKDNGYFDRLDTAKGINEAEEKGTYKEFMTMKLKKYGVKSPAELDDAKKKEFFDEIDKDWDGENEND